MFEGLFQPMHLVIIVGVVLLFFGPQKLPQLGKGMGEALRGFKKALHEETAEEKPALDKSNEKHTPQS